MYTIGSEAEREEVSDSLNTSIVSEPVKTEDHLRDLSVKFNTCFRLSEQKIDHIDRRLDGVLLLLQELKAQRLSTSPRPNETVATIRTANSLASPVSHVSHATHATQARAAGVSGTVVEGDSSITAHSVFASDLVQKAVSKDSRPEMRERLDALGRILEAMRKQPAAHEMTYPHAKPVPPPAMPRCDLPPIEKTLQVLKLAKCVLSHP